MWGMALETVMETPYAGNEQMIIRTRSVSWSIWASANSDSPGIRSTIPRWLAHWIGPPASRSTSSRTILASR